MRTHAGVEEVLKIPEIDAPPGGAYRAARR